MPATPRKSAAKSILVPIDGSEASIRALDCAIDQSRPTGAEVHVLHVEHAFDDFGAAGAAILKKSHHERTLERAHTALAPAIARLGKARVPHRDHVAWGEPAETIASIARSMKCGSIVMATRGMNAIGNLLMGSTATKVIHLADVPVTLVK